MRKTNSYGHPIPRMMDCPECGSKIAEVEGEFVCTSCGLVLGNSISNRGEWRSYTLQEWRDRSRVGGGMRYSLHDYGLHSEIGYSKQKQHRRLRRTQRRTLISGESKTLATGLSYVSSICNRFRLPDHAREEASMILRKVLSKHLCRGRGILTIASACVYLACRLHDIPVSNRELSREYGFSRKKLDKTYREIVEGLDIKVRPPDPARYISRIVSRLGLPTCVEERAMRILRSSQKKGVVSGKNPIGVASVCVWIASRLEGIPTSQSDITNVLGARNLAMKSRHEILRKLLE